ncbi:hypothetical protein PRIPAC_82114 [Pristionchus pacificus]|uniref:Uncharacterized protein n=1 Tax=Pristionchus pacificus TaxID=54126 RepID=A0A2A6BXR6_PRIPA|nr:hypothetical protein PRIPAC_82114 [Pristionchus pacificus]|eukprot:PDM70551.1 hypothetical protein PRIPAC_46797 [Pristionchus pacificus]
MGDTMESAPQCLAYEDDLCLIDSDVARLEKKVHAVQKRLEAGGLTLNTGKTEPKKGWSKVIKDDLATKRLMERHTLNRALWNEKTAHPDPA